MEPEHQHGEPPLINVTGDKVALGPLRRDLLPTYQRWGNDFAAMRTVGRAQPLTLEQLTAQYEHVTISEDSVSFTIYELATWRPIGTTALERIDFRTRTADFTIGIGEPECRGKGYGTEATSLMLDYAFTALGLHNVMLLVYEFNLAGLHAYQKAGFREFGRRRQSQWMGGKLWDVVYMDCLAMEFTSPVLGRIFVPDQPRS
jgi:RimJ/RimL family protein N-acetyltransferase